MSFRGPKALSDRVENSCTHTGLPGWEVAGSSR